MTDTTTHPHVRAAGRAGATGPPAEPASASGFFEPLAGDGRGSPPPTQRVAARTSPAPRPRRRHPSQGARVVALLSSVAATGGLSAVMASATHASSASSTVVSGRSAASAAPTGTTVSYTDGTYTGTAVDNTFGNVQVQVKITNHKVVSVQEVQSPSDRKSQAINSSAAPVLEQEAVAAQSSNLQVVSGATYTTKAYATSLQAALDQAKPTTSATPTTAATTPTTTTGAT